MEFFVNKFFISKIKEMDKNKKVRIFNRSFLENEIDKILIKRKELMTLETLDDSFLTNTIRIDLTNGMKDFRAGPHSGLRIHPAGDWFVFEKVKGKWQMTACGRH